METTKTITIGIEKYDSMLKRLDKGVALLKLLNDLAESGTHVDTLAAAIQSAYEEI